MLFFQPCDRCKYMKSHQEASDASRISSPQQRTKDKQTSKQAATSPTTHTPMARITDIIMGNAQPGDHHHHQYESSGSRMRRMDYGRMEHDVGYGTPPSLPSRSHSRKHRSTHRSDPADHHAQAINVSTGTENSHPSRNLPHHLPHFSSHYEPSHHLRRSSSHYEPETPRRSKSRNHSGVPTISPVESYGDCVGRGNPYTNSARFSATPSHHSSLSRNRSAAAWEAEERERNDTVPESYAHSAKGRARNRDTSGTSGEWEYDWPSPSMSACSRTSSSVRSGGRGQSYW